MTQEEKAMRNVCDKMGIELKKGYSLPVLHGRELSPGDILNILCPNFSKLSYTKVASVTLSANTTKNETSTTIKAFQNLAA